MFCAAARYLPMPAGAAPLPLSVAKNRLNPGPDNIFQRFLKMILTMTLTQARSIGATVAVKISSWIKNLRCYPQPYSFISTLTEVTKTVEAVHGIQLLLIHPTTTLVRIKAITAETCKRHCHRNDYVNNSTVMMFFLPCPSDRPLPRSR